MHALQAALPHAVALAACRAPRGCAARLPHTAPLSLRKHACRSSCRWLLRTCLRIRSRTHSLRLSRSDAALNAINSIWTTTLAKRRVRKETPARYGTFQAAGRFGVVAPFSLANSARPHLVRLLK